MSSRIAALVVLTGLSLTACADDDRAVGSVDGTIGGTTTTATSNGDGGWLGGEPAWTRGPDSGATEFAAAETWMAADAKSLGVSDDAPVPPLPVPPLPRAPDLRAGSVDDNAAFDDYLEYLGRIESLGIELRDFDPTGRIVVSVTGTSGLPVAGADIEVTAKGALVAHLRTTAGGTARLHPALYGAAEIDEFVFSTGGVSATAVPGGSVVLPVNAAGGAQAPVAVDVLFLLDATGSMGDEIGRLKSSIDSVAAQVAGLQSQPDVRFAMTLYRDLGDLFVTSTFDFTADVAAFRAALADVVADGGDDYPEALEEGIAEALTLPSWRDPATTIQLMFLVADAPPQISRQVATHYPESIATAIERGLKIFPVASSESDDQAEAVFRQVAQATGSRFVFLTYGAGGAAVGGSTDIDSTDYEELALDQLVVRLIAEELSALTGDPIDETSPTTSPTPTTVPDGQ